MSYYVDQIDLQISAVIALVSFGIILLSLFGKIIQQNLHLSDILLLLSIGIMFSFIVYEGPDINSDPDTFFQTLLWLTRFVLAFQLMATALSLDSDYVNTHKKTLSVLLLIVMPCMWIISTLLIFLILRYSFLDSLLIGAILTPTDPILAATVVRSGVSKRTLPNRLRSLISAESGANDGLAFPFISLPLLLLANPQNLGGQIGGWFYWTILYQIVFNAFFSYAIGAVSAILLNFCETREFVDRITLLVYTTSLAIFLMAVAILINVNELLSVFVGGIGFIRYANHDDVFEEEKIQESIDLLTTFFFFAFFGLIIPWTSFGEVGVGWLFLCCLIIPLRRFFCILAVYKLIPDIKDVQEASFVGWFGPVGVAALYYCAVTYKELKTVIPFIIISFFVLFSTVFYGVTSTFLTRKLGNHISGG